MSQEQDLERWLRQQLFRQRETALEKFVLRNARSGSKGSEVEEFELHGQVNGEDIPLMRDQILSSAQRDADALGTKLQSYALVAVEVGNRNGPRHHFRVRGDGDEDDEGSEEMPNEKGIISQLMRHNEAMMRMMTMGNQAVISTLSKQLEESHRANEKLLSQRQEAFQAIEEAKSQQHERELQLLTVGNQEERKSAAHTKILGKFELLFPILFNKLSGKKVLSEEENSVLGAFVESLSQEQLGAIAQQLSLEQQAALMNMYRDIKAKTASKSTNGAS